MNYVKPSSVLIENPIGLDAAIKKIQSAFITSLSWLSVCYGKAETGLLMKPSERKEYKYPEVYIGKGRYLMLEPNNYLDAHCFFKAEGPQASIGYKSFLFNRYQQPLSIIFWLNLDKINKLMNYGYQHRFTEEIKRQILDVLRNHSDFTVERIFETPADVFAGYSYDHLTNQTFKHPEAGFKFTGTIVFKENCV